MNKNGSRPLLYSHFVFDAWNRMVTVKADSSGSPGSTIASYTYDGRNRRITKTLGGQTYHGYYNNNWQYLETRIDSATTSSGQVVWDLRYIDSPLVLLGGANPLYYTNDANFNVTALINGSTGAVSERSQYDPYGNVQFYTAAWATTASSAGNNPVLYAGYTFDGESGMYLARNRYLNVALGSWEKRDRIGYLAGLNLFAYVKGRVVRSTDPSGLCRCECSPPNPIFGFPNEYRRKFYAFATTSLGITVSQQNSPTKWVEAAGELQEWKELGNLAMSVAAGAAEHGTLEGAAEEMWKDKVKSMAENTFKDRVLQENEEKVTGIVEALLDSIKEIHGFYLWVGYSYSECVLCKKDAGEWVEKSDEKDIRWVQCTEGAGNSVDAKGFGGEPGINKSGGLGMRGSNLPNAFNMAMCPARALSDGGGKSYNDTH